MRHKGDWNRDMKYNPTANDDIWIEPPLIDRILTWITGLVVVEILCHPIDYLSYVWDEIRNKDRQMMPYEKGEIAAIPLSDNLKGTKGKSKSYASRMRGKHEKRG